MVKYKKIILSGESFVEVSRNLRLLAKKKNQVAMINKIIVLSYSPGKRKGKYKIYYTTRKRKH